MSALLEFRGARPAAVRGQRGAGLGAQELLRASEHSRRVLLSVLEDQVRVESSLRAANRVLRTLGAAHRALHRASDPTAFLQEMVQVVVQQGGYPLAWIGEAAADEGRTIKPRAALGISLEALHAPPFSWAEDEGLRSALGFDLSGGSHVVVRRNDSPPAFARCAETMEGRGLGALIALPLCIETRDRSPYGLLMIGARELDAFDAEELQLLQQLAADVGFGIRSLSLTAERNASAAELRRSLEDTIGTIAATLEARDPYTAGHQRRVAGLASAIAREMGLPEETARGVHFGAMIHDLGKIRIPAEILSKPGRLGRIELELIRTHAQAGYEIVKDLRFPWPVAAMVHQHHERLDGSGYPQGLRGDEIVLEARIIALADVVEAMASHRPYRAGLGVDRALAEVRARRGTWFDPIAVDACVRLFSERGFSLDNP